MSNQSNSPSDEGCRLYLITPPAFDPDIFGETLQQTLSGGDVACLQLRLKPCDDDAVRRATESLMPICHEHDVAFVMNDRPDLALELGADGLHVGQDDMAYSEARALVGDDVSIGVTCHNSSHLAMDAAGAGADYVAFGAFFPTQTKEPKSQADVETLHSWSLISIVPCVAIGGITVDNCRPLVEAGAEFLAVVSGIWDHAEGPAAAVKEFNTIFRDSA